jgi:hypothetical protein
MASIACLPRRGCTMSRVYLPVRAQCTQCSLPATRNPVSSKPATSLTVMFSLTCSTKPSSFPAARAVSAATVPGDSGMPNSSASAWPGCPSCPPGLRPVFRRSDRDRGGGFANPSPDGGLEEFRDVFRSRSSSSAIRSCARASSPRSDTTSADSTSYDGGSRSAGTRGQYRTQIRYRRLKGLGSGTALIMDGAPGVIPASRMIYAGMYEVPG